MCIRDSINAEYMGNTSNSQIKHSARSNKSNFQSTSTIQDENIDQLEIQKSKILQFDNQKTHQNYLNTIIQSQTYQQPALLDHKQLSQVIYNQSLDTQSQLLRRSRRRIFDISPTHQDLGKTMPNTSNIQYAMNLSSINQRDLSTTSKRIQRKKKIFEELVINKSLL
eukprot:TRINITY_DN8129_c0_g1_i2.p2 TRINITY_DN8129_c0_g1~~TRINITY_DN8129_c0_g1_i2.p2  ORF type:complete len:167 (-),score=28.23 TRINITY_DN8129_c0_g1_i2:191-691(-)